MKSVDRTHPEHVLSAFLQCATAAARSAPGLTVHGRARAPTTPQRDATSLIPIRSIGHGTRSLALSSRRRQAPWAVRVRAARRRACARTVLSAFEGTIVTRHTLPAAKRARIALVWRARARARASEGQRTTEHSADLLEIGERPAASSSSGGAGVGGGGGGGGGGGWGSKL
jgi:hypothetical protein